MSNDYTIDPSSTHPSIDATRLIERVVIICVPMACVSVTLRLWSRLHTGKRELGVDDGAMVGALLFFVWVCVIAMNLVSLEYKNPTLTAAVADVFLFRLTIAEAVFMIDTVFLKVSLLVYYRQFVWQKWQRRAIWTAGICSIVISTIALFLALFQCGTPKNLAWKHVNGHCMSRDLFLPILYVHGAFSALTDWAFALLPIAVLIKSSLRPAVKASVCCLLALGVLGSVAACFRTVFVPGIWFDPIFLDPTHQPDFYTYSATEISLALIELGFGISAASLACLQPLLRRFGHKTKSWFYANKYLMSWKLNTPDHTMQTSSLELPTVSDLLAPKPSRRRSFVKMPPVPPRIPTRASRHSIAAAAAATPGKQSIGVLPSVASFGSFDDGEDVRTTPPAYDDEIGAWRKGLGVLPTVTDTVAEKEEAEYSRRRDREWERRTSGRGVGASTTVDTMESGVSAFEAV